MMFESSYSGVTTWDKVPMKEAAEFLYKTYRLIFRDIAEQFGEFKIKGELIWIDELEESGKVTPVGASYLTNKFGRYGGIVVFEIFKIEGDKLSRFSEEDEETIMEMIQDMNNDEFSFYLIDSINITKNVTFTLDVDSLLNLISNPEFDKPRFNPEKDAKLLEEIEKIKADVCRQLSDIVDHTKGAFSAEGDLIEGIVVKINKSGNQYGMFSDKYRDTKKVYWDSFEQIKPIYIEFFKNVFGYIPLLTKKKVLPALEVDPEQFKAAYDKYQPKYYEKIKQAYETLVNDNNVPKAAKRVQLSMRKTNG